jgi:hypothetical protein
MTNTNPISYLLYFQEDNTFSVVPKRAVLRISEINHTSYAHGGYGNEAYRGLIVCSGEEKEIRQHMRAKKYTKSCEDEDADDDEDDSNKENKSKPKTKSN